MNEVTKRLEILESHKGKPDIMRNKKLYLI